MAKYFRALSNMFHTVCIKCNDSPGPGSSWEQVPPSPGLPANTEKKNWVSAFFYSAEAPPVSESERPHWGTNGTTGERNEKSLMLTDSFHRCSYNAFVSEVCCYGSVGYKWLNLKGMSGYVWKVKISGGITLKLRDPESHKLPQTQVRGLCCQWWQPHPVWMPILTWQDYSATLHTQDKTDRQAAQPKAEGSFIQYKNIPFHFSLEMTCLSHSQIQLFTITSICLNCHFALQK